MVVFHMKINFDNHIFYIIQTLYAAAVFISLDYW